MELLRLLAALVDLFAQLAGIQRLLYLLALRGLRVEQLGPLYVGLEMLVDLALLVDSFHRVLLDKDIQCLHQAGQVVRQASLLEFFVESILGEILEFIRAVGPK